MCHRYTQFSIFTSLLFSIVDSNGEIKIDILATYACTYVYEYICTCQMHNVHSSTKKDNDFPVPCTPKNNPCSRTPWKFEVISLQMEYVNVPNPRTIATFGRGDAGSMISMSRIL